MATIRQTRIGKKMTHRTITERATLECDRADDTVRLCIVYREKDQNERLVSLIQWVRMTPEEAKHIGEGLIRAAAGPTAGDGAIDAALAVIRG